jgi:hypothetical protein
MFVYITILYFKYLFYKYIKKLLPLTANEPVAPVGNEADGLIISVPSEFMLNLSTPFTLTVNKSPDGDGFVIRDNDDVNAPIKFTEPVISELVVTIVSIDVVPLASFLKNNLPSNVFTANSPNDKSLTDGTFD